MPIQIKRGIFGDSSPYIFFTGSTNDGDSPATQKNYILDIAVGINSIDPNSIDIIDNPLTVSAGTTIYNFQQYHYNNFIDENGNAFASALDLENYINNQIADSLSNLQRLQEYPNCHHHTTTHTTPVGVAFTYSATNYHNGIGFFWDESSFPPGVEVSRFDRRKISGIITQTGSYDILFDVVNQNGISSTSVEIIVV